MSSLVAIQNSRGVAVGAGVLVTRDLVLTCSHVVNVALGRANSEPNRPRPDAVLSVAFEVAPQERRNASVATNEVAWSAPPASVSAGADICLLRLREVAPASATFAKLRALDFDNPFNARASGFPEVWNQRPNTVDVDYALVDVIGPEGNLWLLRADPAAANAAIATGRRPAGLIHAGFSGGPVDRDGEVVAIAAEARRPEDATAYAIPISRIAVPILDSLGVLPAGFERVAPHAEDLFARIRIARQQLAVELELSIRLCQTYDDVLATYRNAGRPTPDEGPPRDLGVVAFAQLMQTRAPMANGHRLTAVLLSSPGGAGKTRFLERLVLAAPTAKLVPFYLDFAKALRAPRDTADAEEALEDWFGMCGAGDYAGFRDLARGALGINLRPLLIIDALNQAKVIAEHVLASLTELLNGVLPQASVVVSDRLILRQASDRFHRAAIAPLRPAEIRRGLEGLDTGGVESDAGWQPLLSSPFYLGQLRQLITRSGRATASGPVPSRFTLLDSTLREVHGLQGKDRNAVAHAAFQLYRSRKSTAFDEKTLQSALEDGTRHAGLPPERASELTQILLGRGLVHATTESMEFSHQLLHDFLAASRIAATTDGEDADLLRAPAFDALSLDAASPDAIEMAVEALETPDWHKQHPRVVPLDPRRFLTEVYDWNYWITLQAVMSLDRRQALSSPHLRIVRHAVYALNVEKRFDLFVHSSERIKAILEQLAGSTAIEYVKSEKLTELPKLVSQAVDLELASLEGDGKTYWQYWLSLYLDQIDELSMIDSLWKDPLIGWTAANVLRRRGFGESTTSELLRLYRISRSTSDRDLRAAGFRWRLVHALSGARDESAADALVAVALDLDEDPNIRYGAVRSAVEIAALRRSDGGTGVLKLLTESLYRFFPKEEPGRWDRPSASVRQQLRRCCAINEPTISNRTDRVPVWKNHGLAQYQMLLERGENLASDQEKRRWASWLSAVVKVRATGDDEQEWPARLEIWRTAIKAEN